jgi:hypothetical protein
MILYMGRMQQLRTANRLPSAYREEKTVPAAGKFKEEAEMFGGFEKQIFGNGAEVDAGVDAGQGNDFDFDVYA